jgi:predicted RNase H-like HicB family nuclease
MTKLEYHAAYYEIEDGWYMAVVLDFPGTISQGKTLRSARRMIRDALRLMAETTLEDGQPLPRPNPRARDKKAVFAETIPLKLLAQTGAVP